MNSPPNPPPPSYNDRLVMVYLIVRRENVRILEAHNDHFPNLGDLGSLIIEVIE